MEQGTRCYVHPPNGKLISFFFEKSLRFHLIQKFCSKAFGVDWVERIRIIYVGDDFTDEDAIKALKGSRIREIKK